MKNALWMAVIVLAFCLGFVVGYSQKYEKPTGAGVGAAAGGGYGAPAGGGYGAPAGGGYGAPKAGGYGK